MDMKTIEDVYTVTPTQEGMLFHSLYNPESGMYSEQISCTFKGFLHYGYFKAAWKEVIKRYPILRTSFVWDGVDYPLQVVNRDVELPWRELDWSSYSLEAQETRLTRLLEENKLMSYDLARAPLMVMTIIKGSEDTTYFIWNNHHLLMDGWSLGILLKEVMFVYEALKNGTDCTLPPAPPYRNYIGWLQEQSIEKAREFWKDKFKGFKEPVRMFIQKEEKDSGEKKQQWKEFSVSLDKAFSDKLKDFSRENSITLNTLFQGVLACLEAHFSNKRDIVFGVTVSGRPPELAGVEDMVGMFINTLPNRIAIEESMDVSSFLQNIQRQQVEMEGFAYTSLAEIQKWVMEKNQSLFNTILVFENYLLDPSIREGSPDFSLQDVRSYERTNYPLTIIVLPGEEIQIRFIYNVDLFPVSDISFYVKHMTPVLEKFVTAGEFFLEDCALDVEIVPPASGPERKEVPLSYHQERIWFIDQFETGKVYDHHPVYHTVPVVIELKEAVDRNILQKSLDLLVKQNPLLSSIIKEKGESFILAENDVRLIPREIDLTSEEDPGAKAESLIREAAEVPPDLKTPGHLKVLYYSLSSSRSLLVLLSHHCFIDKDSTYLIASDLSRIYSLLRDGKPVPEIERREYADFAAWQKDMPPELFSSLCLYWKKKLGGKLAALELPEDFLRPAIHTYTAGTLRFSPGEELLEKLRQFCDRHNLKLQGVVFGAFFVLMQYYTHQKEIVLGAPCSPREKLGMEGRIGPFSNLLVYREFLDQEDTVLDVIRRVSSSIQENEKKGFLPFDKMVQVLNPEKDMSRTALFDVLFDYRKVGEELEFGDVSAEVLDLNLGYGKYDINFSLQDKQTGLSGTWVYNQDIYKKETMCQMLKHYTALLSALTTREEQPLKDLFLLDEEEISLQLDHMNRSGRAADSKLCIHHYFEKQTGREPGKAALRMGDAIVTYGELNHKANQLAHYLQGQCDVKKGDLVAICFNRSPEMITAILGILKAGAAYLPLDSSSPESRVAYILEDAGVKVCVTDIPNSGKIANRVTRAVNMEKDASLINQERGDNPGIPSKPEDLAYLLYTSGSTGKPKGVLIQHNSVLRLFFNEKPLFDFSNRDVWTLFHSYYFDFSVWEIWGALLLGGELIIVDREATRDPYKFKKMLSHYGVTVLNQTPSVFYNLAKTMVEEHEDGLGLRYVIFGGEALDPVQLSGFHEKYPDVKLINMFGITETTVHVTFKELSTTDIQSNISNVGKSIPATMVYIMDKDLKLVPLGVGGEICVSGEGVARGYLNRRELTKEKFVINPYTGERLYRSGDVGKFLWNGDIRYCGRMDDQVQVRGFRVELGEIQSCLQEYPGVAHCVVLYKAEGVGKLLAYVVPEKEIDLNDIRRYLSDKLPYYMVPSRIKELPVMPLTTNGKIDRKRILAEDDSDMETTIAFVPPRDDMEKKLAAIWQEVLQVNKAGIYDNFFDLGGHSLLVTQAVSRIRDQFEVDLSISSLFVNPTIAGVASQIKEILKETTGVDLTGEREEGEI